MKGGNQHIKRAVYVLFVFCLLLPFLQMQFGIFENKPLHGVHQKSFRPILTFNALQEGNFQAEYEKYLDNSIGFRGDLIRLNNQIKFSLFDRINSDGVILGKNKMVFHENYITSYLGQDYIGKDSIIAFAHKLKELQDSLQSRDISFFIMIPAGKASIYPENIPDEYFEMHAQTTNYETLIAELEKNKVNFLDLKAFLLANKENFSYPIFPSHGVHWSGNTVAIVADTLTKYIKSTFNIPVPLLRLSPGETTFENYRYTDYDIGEAMNLLSFVSTDSLHYPQVNFVYGQNSIKPDFLGVGDSFFQSFIGFYSILDSIFSKDSRLWYYNKIVEWPNRFFGKGIEVEQLDHRLEILSKDLIILEMTEENIRLKGFGFVEDVLGMFKNNEQIPDYLEVEYEGLLQDSNLIKKAEELHQLIGYTKDQMLHALAVKKLKKQKGNINFEQEVQQVMQAIYQDGNWLKNIREQAIKENISLEENIRKNAEWVVNEKHK